MKKRRNRLIALTQVLALACTLVMPAMMPVQAAEPQTVQETAQESAVTGRQILNFNSDWGFYRGDLEGAEAEDFDDSAFANVTIPHTMRLEKKHCNGGAGTYKGIGWYRRYFTLGEEYAGKKINIDFEGVMIDSDIYLNGEKIYTRNGGYMGFSVDITDEVKLGETNVLAVRVSSQDNPDTPPGRPEANLDFHYYGGIYRDVTLRVTDQVYISDALQADTVAGGGVFVTYPEVSEERATVRVNTQVVNEQDADTGVVVEQKLKDEDGQVAASVQSQTVSLEAGAASQIEVEMTVEQPKLWHPEHPDLYDLETTVYQDGEAVDSVTTRIGIRTIDYKSDGFYINGERLYLRGANRHQAYLNVGDAGSNSMQYRDALLLKESGFNSVRAAHYPQDPAFLAACDEVGILVIECQPGWQNFTNTQTFYDRTIRDTREMIRRDRNHPSVVLWESSLNETWVSEKWVDDALEAAHSEYPGDQFFAASDYGFYGEKYDVCYKVQDTQWSSDPSKWKDFNPDKPFFTREWGDYEGSSKALRKEGTATQNTQILTRQRYLNGNGYSDWGGLDASERIGGHFLWSFNDYSRGSNSKTLGSGVVDIDRYEKNCFYWLKSMQSARNPVYGPMIYISSDYTEDSSKDVMVFSNCDSVKLYQNGELVNEIQREDALKSVPNIAAKGGSPIFTFHLDQVGEGSLKAEGILDGEVAAVHEIQAPQGAIRLEVEIGDRGVTPVADGSDLVPVYIKAVDENGTVVPDFDGKVHVSVSGEGELVGKDIPRIKVEDQVLENGIGSAFVRTSEMAGTVTITASSEGLADGTGTVETTEYTGTFVPEGEHTPWEGGVEKLEEEIKENIAAGKPVTFSSQQNGNEGVKGVDDDESTRWCASGGSLPQWYMIDLEKKYALSGFQILWENSGAKYQYVIEVSDDGEAWTTAVDMSGNNKVNGADTQVAAVEGRYVKITITGISDGWASLYEFRVFEDTERGEMDPGEVIPDEKVKEITATGGEVEDRGTDKLRDGVNGIGTGWLSASKEFPQSVTLEFAEPQDLLGSRIYWEKDSSWYTYDLEVSKDGEKWSKVIDSLTVGGQHYKAETFEEMQTGVRFVRVTIKNIVAGGDYNIGMAEWILYGKDAVKRPIKEFEYASDLKWESAYSDYGSVTKDAGVYGGSIVLNSENGKITFEKGLSADTYSEIVYNVEGKGYTFFDSYIGINANAGKQGGEAIFKIYKDDELIYTSQVKMRNDNCDFVSVNIEGAKKVRLVADWSGNPDNSEARYNTHVDWAGAKFYCVSTDRVELRHLYDQEVAARRNAGDYSKASYAAYLEQLTQTAEVLTDEDYDDAQIQEFVQSLKDAVDGLKLLSEMTQEELIEELRQALAEAESAKKEAEDAKKAADEALERAQELKEAADAAQEEALAWQDKAEKAEEEARQALEEAEAIKKQAGEESQAAKEAMELAEKKAEEAKSAKEEADAKQALADQAKQEADAAKAQAEEDSAAAEAAKEAAEAELEAAKQAKAAADAALEEANKKIQEAEEEKKLNEKLLEEIKAQREAAEKAAAEAQKAVEDLLAQRCKASVTLKKVKSTGKKKLQVTWKKAEGADGYQIQYSTNAKFKNGKTKKISQSKASVKLTGLKSGKKYYVRIRAYYKNGSSVSFGKYSKTKSIKVK
ncbi:MAG: discoidin domain-containing protein [Lachnospiraceae bacterium]|nr:discoidin domain-containing protein [Lachnospiraceae bacterium]